MHSLPPLSLIHHLLQTDSYLAAAPPQMHYTGHVKRSQDLHGLLGDAFWSMHHAYGARNPNRYSPSMRLHPIFRDRVVEVHGYETIAFFRRGGPTYHLSHMTRGTDRLPDYHEG